MCNTWDGSRKAKRPYRHAKPSDKKNGERGINENTANSNNHRRRTIIERVIGTRQELNDCLSPEGQTKHRKCHPGEYRRFPIKPAGTKH